MRLTIADVEHVAALARLGLSDDEKERMRDQLSSILGHINELSDLDTGAIPPTAQVISLSNVLREDEVRPSLSREDVLRNAPRQSDGFFEVHTPLGGADEGTA
jgi:aspartyl-tRNA(Asn)/glutamyl-tRNA(Gln) amidotransferase subunit C